MSLLVVGSVAFDTVETPFGRADRVLGGSATFFAFAASYYVPTRLVGIVGKDFPQDALEELAARGIDLSGLTISAEGKTFHWTGKYEGDMNEAHTIGVSKFAGSIHAGFDSVYVGGLNYRIAEIYRLSRDDVKIFF